MVTPLLWIAAYLATGLCLSLAVVVFDIVSEWRQGNDITLGQLGMLVGFVLLMILIWPVWIVLACLEWIRENWRLGKHTVILRGSRSAKVYRALRDDL